MNLINFSRVIFAVHCTARSALKKPKQDEESDACASSLPKLPDLQIIKLKQLQHHKQLDLVLSNRNNPF